MMSIDFSFGKGIGGALVASFLLLHVESAGAQAPVQWSYSAKAVGSGVYEVSITAVMKDGWHVYSQRQPKEAVAIPTRITYMKSPTISLEGPTEEKGNKQLYENKEVGIKQYQYADSVTFVQRVKLKKPVKANISGKIHFQVCTDDQCLPPADSNFKVALMNTDR